MAWILILMLGQAYQPVLADYSSEAACREAGVAWVVKLAPSSARGKFYCVRVGK